MLHGSFTQRWIWHRINAMKLNSKAAQPGASSKERILDAARGLFGTFGYTETTYRRIAGAAEVPEGLIAHHFASKENLYVEVALDVLDRLTIDIDESLLHTADSMGAVIAFCECFLNFSRNAATGFIALLRCSPFAPTDAGPRQGEILDRCAGIADRLCQIVAQGHEDRSIRPCDPQLQTKVIIAALIGATRAYLLNQSNFLGIDDPEAFYRETIVTLAAGLSSQAGPLPHDR
ncbi:MAG: TetR/AcrR family transcriptional regulator [Deltaproteobacteria bacterium]|nr:TetR/AcrR family transcriptional regulator [Deltaproteobacteria bacterium]